MTQSSAVNETFEKKQVEKGTLRCLTWEYYNVMEHQGGRDFVLLEVNGILEHLLSMHDQNTALSSSAEWIDWQEHGGQFLHFTYLLEKFIKSLVSRSVQFRVVMFDQHDQLLMHEKDSANAVGKMDVSVADGRESQSPQYRMARRLLHQHLTKHCNVTVDVFEGSWFQNEKWLDYLRSFRPSFVVTSAKNARLFTMYNLVTEQVTSVCDLEFVGNNIFAFTARLLKEPSELHDDVVQLISEVTGTLSPQTAASVANGNNGITKQIASDDADFADLDRDRLELVLNALTHLLQSENDKERCKQKLQMSQLLLASQLIVTHVPLAYRAHKLPVGTISEFNDFLNEFIEDMIVLMDAQAKTAQFPDLYDILDGRLFYKLAMIYHQHYVSTGETSLVMDLSLPDTISKAWKKGRDILVQAASTIIGDHPAQQQCNGDWWSKVLKSAAHDDGSSSESMDSLRLTKLIPMHNNLIDGILGEWNNKLPQYTMREYEKVVAPQLDSMFHHDLKSWKQTKLVDTINRTLSDREKKKIEETQRRLHAYGDSMSKLSEKKTIEVGALSKRLDASKPNAKRELMKAQNTKDQTLKKIKDIRVRYDTIIGRRTREERDVLEKSAQLQKEVINKVEDVISDFNRNWVQWSRFVKEKKWKPADLKTIQGARSSVYDFAIQVQFTKLKLNVDRWLNFRPNDEECVYQVFEWINFVHDLCYRWETERGKSTTASDKQKDIDRYKEIVESLVKCGLDDYAKKIVNMHPDIKPFFPKLMTDNVRNKRDPYKLQLKYNSKYLTVANWFPKEESVRDKLKKNEAMFTLNFEPDPWQQTLIDHVKKKRSVLCSAPTSSGKTFIAFYLIEKVLRESNDSVVVFVLPTPALANQVYAEVYARFNKTYNTPNMHMLGMFTGPEKINVNNSQILVTVPSCLEMLMLNPGNNAWKRKLQYVILDEIHCIGSEGGEVWEHILAMIDCPFLALSATIGNPEEFRNWLNSSRGDVELVMHKERPCALEYQVYQPQVLLEDEKCIAEPDLVEVHPCAVLNAQRIDPHEVENMPLFSSLQCLDLYNASQVVANKHQETNLFAQLQPSISLKPVGLLTQSEFSAYRRDLRSRLVELANDANQHARLLEIFQVLRSGVDSVFSRVHEKYSATEFDSEQYLKDHFVDLSMQLRDSGQLPSIMFHFNRYMINELLEKLVAYLKETNQHMWTSEVERTASLTAINAITRDISSKVDPLFVEALERGVAVHYNAIHNDYLKEVERLFRSRLVPVMIATGNLALGVHMPCRTVAIIGKSIYLTTSLFNQCSGRAGRRNFDTKGKVVLYGISQVNMNRLMTGANPRINGSMGLSPSFIMRLMMLYNATVDSDKGKVFEKQVFDDCTRVLKQPLFSLGHLIDDVNQVKYYFRHLLEMFARERYFDAQCSPMEWTNLVAGTFNMEPLNFVITRILKEGVFHEIMDQKNLPYQVRLEQIMAVLATLFGRRTISESNDTCRTLPELLPIAKQANNNQEKLVLEVLASYVRGFSQEFPDLVQDCALPLSGIQFKYQPPDARVLSKIDAPTSMGVTTAAEKKGDSDEEDDDLKWDSDEGEDDLKWDSDEDEEEKEKDNVGEANDEQVHGVDESSAEPTGEDIVEHLSEGTVVDALRDDRLNYFAVSSFFALSGHGDNFDSMDRLLETLRHTIQLDKSIIPTLNLHRGRQNSYALDFLRHGLLENLRRQNDYANTNAAKTDLEKMSRYLKSLYSSLSNYIDPGKADPVFHALEELSEVFSSKLRQRPVFFMKALKFSIRHVNEHIDMIAEWINEQQSTTEDDTEKQIQDYLKQLFLLQEADTARDIRSNVSVSLHITTQTMEIISKTHPMYDRVHSIHSELTSVDREFKQGKRQRGPRDVRVEDDGTEEFGLGKAKESWGDKHNPEDHIERRGKKK